MVELLEKAGAQKGMTFKPNDPATELCDAAAKDIERLRYLVNQRE